MGQVASSVPQHDAMSTQHHVSLPQHVATSTRQHVNLPQHDVITTQQRVNQHVPQHDGMSTCQHASLPKHVAMSTQQHVNLQQRVSFPQHAHQLVPKHATQLTKTTVPVVGTVSRRIDPEQTELEEDSIPRPATYAMMKS